MINFTVQPFLHLLMYGLGNFSCRISAFVLDFQKTLLAPSIVANSSTFSYSIFLISELTGSTFFYNVIGFTQYCSNLQQRFLLVLHSYLHSTLCKRITGNLIYQLWAFNSF
jgi:hypothetical protein